MNNTLQVFDYKGSAVRTVEKDGEIWFVAKDVCDVLELKNARDAISELDEDEKNSVAFSDGNRGNPNMNIISEAGVYTLVFRSNKPEAKNFSRWVRHEVLPEIRQTGSYNGQRSGVPSGVMDGARLIFETAGIIGNQAALALDKVYRSYTGKSALEAGGIELIVQTNRQALTPTEIGHELGLKAQRVNEILAGAGYQHKLSGKWEPLEPGMKFAVMVDTNKKHSDGTPIRQLKWDSSILGIIEEAIA